jgi:DNA polymerase-4
MTNIASKPRVILHVDMDAFFASIEQLDNPALVGLPVLVGSDRPRGVVAAASYEARAFGVHSAQPMVVARRLCPSAVICPTRGKRYGEISKQLFELLNAYSPLIEPLSIDEAFVDATGCDRLFGSPFDMATAIRKQIRNDLQLTASVGIAPNKFLAKLASDLDKPDGLTLIDQVFIQETLPTLPVRKLWGIGPTSAARLESIAIRTIGDLRRCDERLLRNQLGRDAEHYQRLARGEDHRPIIVDTAAKSIGQERTFETDMQDRDEVLRVLFDQVDHVCERLRRHGRMTRMIALKIRYGDFQTITRSVTLPDPSDTTSVVWDTAKAIFEKWATAQFQPVRLIGVSAGSLTNGQGQMGLFDDMAHAKDRQIDQTTDEIRKRFGSDAIRRGGAMDT